LRGCRFTRLARNLPFARADERRNTIVVVFADADEQVLLGIDEPAVLPKLPVRSLRKSPLE